MAQMLYTQAFVKANLYKDSVALMRVAQRLLAMPGVANASLQMGNPANQDILREAGLLPPELAQASPADIMVIVQAGSAAQAKAALDDARAQLSGHDQSGRSNLVDGSSQEAIAATSVAMAHNRMAATNLVQISVPGAYAASEALKAVQRGLNVFMFSDNVPLEQEVALKRAARERGVLVMGPDCGTAIIGGVPLGFANAVRRGAIGIVAASGTGLQEVSTQIHRLGAGVSHAIGTGGRDVKAAVGGITMLQGIGLLARDPQTHVIAVVSKPPAAEVTAAVFAALADAGKPAVVCFIGDDAPVAASAKPRLRKAGTLVDCAATAVALLGARGTASTRSNRSTSGPTQSLYPLAAEPRFAPTQRYLRALFSGGTFAAEALALWKRGNLSVWSNVPLEGGLELPDPKRASREHSALDLGDDAFTVGRPHPMIDQGARIERLLAEAADPSVRVILLDVVIGWGAHANPAAELAPALRQAQALAKRAGRHLAIIGFVCGTEEDPQVLSKQEALLREVGVVLAGNSANAAWLAAQWVK